MLIYNKENNYYPKWVGIKEKTVLSLNYKKEIYKVQVIKTKEK